MDEDEGLFEEWTPELPGAFIDGTNLLKAALAWDVLPHEAVPGLYPDLGLVSESAEGMEMEHAASDARLRAVADLFPMIQNYCAVITDVIGTAMVRVDAEKMKADDVQALNEARLQFNSRNFMIMRAVSCCMIAQLVDRGVLEFSGE